MEAIPTRERPVRWVSPNIESERGEIERVTKQFLRLEPTDENIQQVLESLRAAEMVELSDAQWEKLDNTDSFHKVRPGHVEDAKAITEHYNQTLEPHNQRDFDTLLSVFETAKAIKAPLILRNKGGQTHLVSGNTRLMIARALNIRPKVALADFARQELL